MLFKLDDKRIEISENRIAFAKIRKMFQKYADIAVELFDDLYDNYLTDIDLVSQKAYELGMSILYQEAEIIHTVLVNNKIYDIDIDGFFGFYSEKFCDWEKYYDLVNDQYLKIILNEEEADNYRRNRRENRARWSGGGFGLKGAIKGAVTAEALNIVSGAAHGAINLVGKGISAIGSSIEKKRLYEDPMVKSSLEEGIYNNTLEMMYPFIIIMREQKDVYFDIPTSEDMERASVLYNNLSKISENRSEIISEIIELDPFNEDVYFSLYIHNPSLIDDLKVIMNELEIDIDEKLCDFSEEFMSKYLSEKEPLDNISIEKINEIKNGFEKFLNGYKVSIFGRKIICKLNDRIEQFYIEERTYKGYVYSSVEKKEYAKKIDKQLEELTNNLESSNEEQLRQLLELIDQIEDEENIINIKNPYIEIINACLNDLIAVRYSFIEELNSRLRDLQVVRCIYMGYTYQDEKSKEYAEKVDQEIFRALLGMDNMDEAQLIETIEWINTYEDRENIVNIKMPYMERINKRLNEIMQEKCTYKGYKYQNEKNRVYAERIDNEIASKIVDIDRLDYERIKEILEWINTYEDGENINAIKNQYIKKINTYFLPLKRIHCVDPESAFTFEFILVVKSYIKDNVIGKYDDEIEIRQNLEFINPKYEMSGDYILYISNGITPSIIIGAHYVTIDNKRIEIGNIREVVPYEQIKNCKDKTKKTGLMIYYKDNLKDFFEYKYDAEISSELKKIAIMIDLAIGINPLTDKDLYSCRVKYDLLCMNCGGHSQKSNGLLAFSCDFCETKELSKLYESRIKGNDILQAREKIKNSKKTCINCGKLIKYNAKFCNFCGYSNS